MSSSKAAVIAIDLDSDSDTDTKPALPTARGKKHARGGGCSADAVSIDLTDDSVPAPSGKARKLDGGGPSHAVIDLCDDDGLLGPQDDDLQDFASQFQQSFDEVEIVSEKWVTAPPVSRSTVSRSDGGAASAAGSSSTAVPVPEDDTPPDTENDEDFAARLQAQIDEEIRQDGERREQLADEDEQFARTLQARLNREIEESKQRAAEDILHEQRNRIRSWLATQASKMKIRDVYANPAAMPDGTLYRRFKEAHERARDKSVRLVFHGTREDNIEQICREGLDPSRRGTNGQAHGPGEYFAEDPGISVPYCGGGKKMIVFAVLMDHSGLTKRAGGIVVVNKTEHQLPMFVLTFEPTAQLYQHAAGAAMGLAGLTGPAAAARLAQLRAQLGLGGGGGGFPFGAGAAAAAAAAYGAPPPAPAHRAPRPAARPRNRRR